MRRSWITGKKGFKPPVLKTESPGHYTLELGITPRITYTRPAVGQERLAVHRQNDRILYDTVTYFLNPFLTWLDNNIERTGRCSCTGYQTRKTCRHLKEAEVLALPYKHLLNQTTCEPLQQED